MYNKKNVDYAYLLWEDFIFKIENKNTKKGSAMYYPRFTKLVVNWHYARDDPMFSTINVISRNEATQLYGAILPDELLHEQKDDISWKSSDDDQDDEQDQDDDDAEKHDVHKTTQEEEDDDNHDDDENDQEDDNAHDD
ncbi:hypothetical protein Tco_0126568, partial [Tanacetum coccineum]